MQMLVHIGLLYFVEKIIFDIFRYYCFIFNSFGVEHVPEETKELIGNKIIKTNIFLSTIRTLNNVWGLLHWIH